MDAELVKSAIERAIKRILNEPYVGEFEYETRRDLVADLNAIKEHYLKNKESKNAQKGEQNEA